MSAIPSCKRGGATAPPQGSLICVKEQRKSVVTHEAGRPAAQAFLHRDGCCAGAALWEALCDVFCDTVPGDVRQQMISFFDMHSAEGHGVKVSQLWHELVMKNSQTFAHTPALPDDDTFVPCGVLVHIPTDPTRTSPRGGGHFVYFRGGDASKALSDSVPAAGCLWFMVLLRRADTAAPTSVLCAAFFPLGTDSPFGTGEQKPPNTNAWKLIDHVNSAAQFGCSTLHECNRFKFFIGGQFLPKDGLGRTKMHAPKGGTWAPQNFKTLQPLEKLGIGLTVVSGVTTAADRLSEHGCSVKNVVKTVADVGVSTGGGYAVGLGGYTVGVAVGTVLTGGTGVVAVVVGVGVAQVASYVYGTFVSDRFSSWLWDSPSRGSGIDGSGGSGGDGGDGKDGGDGGSGPGGVDMRKVARLTNFEQVLFALNSDNTFRVFFPLEPGSWKAIEQLVQTRLFPGLTVNPKTLPMIILSELLRCRVLSVPLVFSLHFKGTGGDSDMYSVMHPFLRTTVVGHVLGFIDVFLKGFLNGGVYTEDYIRDYHTGTASDPLSHLVDLQKELIAYHRAAAGDAERERRVPARYRSMRDILEDESDEVSADDAFFTENYTSAFRILGTVNGVAIGPGGLLEPDCGFRVESDLNVKPRLGSQLSGNLGKAEGSATSEGTLHHAYATTHHKMRCEIAENMHRHPRFAPYFELLKIISFCASLADSMAEAGVFPSGMLAGADDGTEGLAIPPFPTVLPSLPIRRCPNVKVCVTFQDVAQQCVDHPELGTVVNHMIREEVGRCSVEERTHSVFSASRYAVQAKLRGLCAFPVDDLDDHTLHVEPIATTFRSLLVRVVFVALSAEIIQSIRAMREADAFADVPTCGMHDFEVTDITTFGSLLAAARGTILPAMERAISAFEHRFTAQLTRKLDEEIDAEKQKTLDRLRREHGFLSTSVSLEVSRMFAETRTEHLPKVTRRATEATNHLRDFMGVFRNEIEKADSSVKNNPIRGMLEADALKPISIFNKKIKLPSAPGKASGTDVVMGVVGGCGLASSAVTMSLSASAAHRHAAFASAPASANGGTRLDDTTHPFYQLDVPVTVYPGGLPYLHELLRQRGPSRDRELLNRCLPVHDGSVGHPPALSKDSFGFIAAHLIGRGPVSLDEGDMDLADASTANTASFDGSRPIHVACASGNAEAVRALLDKGAEPDAVLPNGLSPLLIACQANHVGAALALLQRGDCNVDRCTDTLATPLHWAAIHDSPVLVGELLARGAALLQRRSDSFTAAHIAACSGHWQCLELMVRVNREGCSIAASDGRTPLHYACKAGHTRCASILLGAASSTEDKKNLVLHTSDGERGPARSLPPLLLSLLHGHHETARLLCDAANLNRADVQRCLDSCGGSKHLGACSELQAVPVLCPLDDTKGSAMPAAWKEPETAPSGGSKETRNLSEPFTQDNIEKAGKSREAKKALLTTCVERRSAKCFAQLVRYGGALSVEEKKFLLRTIAEHGLVDWVPVLEQCGTDVSMTDIDGEGRDVLALSVVYKDEPLTKCVWEAYSTALTKRECAQRCVAALTHCTDGDSIKLLSPMLTKLAHKHFFSGLADPLLQTANTTERKWSLARLMGLQPSRVGVIKAAAVCCCSVVDSLLTENYGLLEDVRLHMLKEALQNNRKDNALTIVLHVWPSFTVSVSNPENTALAKTVGTLLTASELVAFHKSLVKQEDVLGSSYALADVSAGPDKGRSFFKSLLERQFYSMTDGGFAAYKWLRDGTTTKFPCPWDNSVKDASGCSFLTCIAVAVCQNPSDIIKITKEAGISAEELLRHEEFTSCLLRHTSPVSVALEIMGSFEEASAQIVAACLCSLTHLDGVSAAEWQQLLQESERAKTLLPEILNESTSADRVTLLMRLIRLAEASCLLDVALSCSHAAEAVQRRDRFGRTVAHHLLLAEANHGEFFGMMEAIRLQRTERLKRVIDLNPSLVFCADREGVTPFHLAAQHNNVAVLSLLSCYFPVNVLTRASARSGLCALHMAAKAAAFEAVQYLLLECGADVNAAARRSSDEEEEDCCGRTALHFASAENHIEVFRLLVQCGADPFIPDEDGDTAVHLAVARCDDAMFCLVRSLPAYWVLLLRGELSASFARNKTLSEALQYSRLAVEPSHTKRTNDHHGKPDVLLAAKWGNSKVVRAHVAAGDDLLTCDDEEWNIVHFAAFQGHALLLIQAIQSAMSLHAPETVERLLTSPSNLGDTPLHLAALGGEAECVNVLLCFRCVRDGCLNKLNKEGLTPSEAAALAGHQQLAIKLLVLCENGSDSFNAEHSGAVDPEKKDALRSFWDSIPSSEIRKAKLEYTKEITSITFKREDVLSQGAAPAENHGGGAAETDGISGSLKAHLSATEASTVFSHPAFSLDSCRVAMLQAFSAESDTASASAVKRLLSLVASSAAVPAHAWRFCVDEILTWIPVDQWEAVANLFVYTGECWSLQRDEYPDASHAVWSWMRLLLSPRFLQDEAGILRSHDTLRLLLHNLSGSSVNEIPYPGAALVAETFDSLGVCTFKDRLEKFTTLLNGASQVNKEVLIRHLNTFLSEPRKNCVSCCPSFPLDKASLRVLEGAVRERFGFLVYDALRVLDEEATESLCIATRRTALCVLQHLSPSTAASALAAVALAVSIYTRSAGVEKTRGVCDKIVSNAKKLGCDKDASFASSFAGILRMLLEVTDTVDALDLVDKAFSSATATGASGLKMATTYVERQLVVVRTERLGGDRSVEDLLAAFGRQGATSSFQPDTFTFDGTPVVCLPQDQLLLLRRSIDAVESMSTGAFSDSALKEQATQLGAQLTPREDTHGGTLDPVLLGNLIGLVREAVFRSTKKRPFRVQCMTVAAFYLVPRATTESSRVRAIKGRLAQVATGEGKSIVVYMLAALGALTGRTVDIITSTPSLAKRDAEESRPFFRMLGLEVSHISVEQPSSADFNVHIVYGTNTDFEFVQLREKCYARDIRRWDETRCGVWVPRKKQIAIVDEADNLFLDAAENSARIAEEVSVSYVWAYAPVFHFISTAAPNTPSPAQIRNFLMGYNDGLRREEARAIPDKKLAEWIRAVRLATQEQERDVDYVVKNGAVIIVDQDTGKLQPGSRWSRTLHEMVEVKEGVVVHKASGTIGSISHPSFFSDYETLFGITGTAGEPQEREEVTEVYQIDTFDVPPHRPCKRVRLATKLFRTRQEQIGAVVEEAVAKRETTSVLILVPSVRQSEVVAKQVRAALRLRGAEASCLLFNETQLEAEDYILLKASQLGTIVVATNNAGRGTDIRPSPAVLQGGGLHVIYAGFPPNLRVECQGIGRAGRQGQPGSSRIIMSLDDPTVKELLDEMSEAETAELHANIRAGQTEAAIKALYESRTRHVLRVSRSRREHCAMERGHYACLCCFAEDLRWLSEKVLTPDNPSTVAAMREAAPQEMNSKKTVKLLSDMREHFRRAWVDFFTELSEETEPRRCLDGAPDLASEGVVLYRQFLAQSNWCISLFLPSPSLKDALRHLLSCLE